MYWGGLPNEVTHFILVGSLSFPSSSLGTTITKLQLGDQFRIR